MKGISKLKSSIRFRLAAFMLMLSLLPLIIISGIVLSTTLSQLSDFSTRLRESEIVLRSDVVGRNLSGAATDSAAVLDSYLLERIADVRRWSEEPAVIDAVRMGGRASQGLGLGAMSPEAVKEQLGGSLFVPIPSELFSPALAFVFLQTERAETPFVEVLATDASGINVLITRPMEAVAHRESDWWQGATSQGVGGIGISDAHIDPATGIPVVGIALPIIDPNSKELLGAVRGLVKLDDLQRRLSQKANADGAEIQVFTSAGLLIIDTYSSHDPSLILQNTMRLDSYPPAQAALALAGSSADGGSMMVEGEQGRQIVGYNATSGSDYYDARAQLSGFEGFRWGVTVAQPEIVALQVLSSLIETGLAFERLPGFLGTTSAVVILIVTVASLMAALLISRGISNPLIELSDMAQQVQGGDLQARVDVRSQDEVGVLASAFNTMTAGLRERERERDIFGRVVSPDVREKLLEGELELGGETLWIAVLFSDIRSFSTISEQMTPQQLIAFLNEYLGDMTSAIRPWGGYINNFIGDAIVAVFGAPIDQPDKEWRAVAAALAMQEQLIALNQRRQARGEQPIRSGVGISTGEAVAGQIGSLERLMYTVIGDSVNVAARLETLTKEYPEHDVLVNGSTAAALEGREEVQLTPLGPIVVKGREEPVEVFAVKAVGKLPPAPGLQPPAQQIP